MTMQVQPQTQPQTSDSQTSVSLSLKEIVERVAEVYPDHFLQQQLQEIASPDFETLKTSEAFAAYLVKEFSDLYDPRSSTDANLKRIVASLGRSRHLLDRVTEALEQVSDKA